MNGPNLPDLDCRRNVEQFVDRFYQRVLADEQLAPVFLDVASIDLDVHLPHIKNYWCKLLLGEQNYRRHTMNIHRALHARRPLARVDFERWLELFRATLDQHYSGPYADKARRIASAIAGNMEQNLPEQAE